MNTDESAGHAAEAAVGLLQDCLDVLHDVRLPLELPGAVEVRQALSSAVVQLDDYILPRYRSLEAPLLAVVGGSTGAGKSTLVNALVGHPVTRSGAIRPTTRQPILLHHPHDRGWFEGDRILPGLPRITGSVVPGGALPGADDGAISDPGGQERIGGQSLVLVGQGSVPQGIALLDAPDIDSVSDANRQLAGQLLAAADLWLFVTTANRYADAVPWRVLAEAASREITLAIILDRVPSGVGDEVAADLRSMLDRQGLADAVLFTVPESDLDAVDMLSTDAVEPIRAWLTAIAADSSGRAAIARKTLTGAVAQLGQQMSEIASAEREQRDVGRELSRRVAEAYDAASQRIGVATTEGTLLRGEVLARWQDFVGTGEFFRSLETGIGKLRDRIGAFFTGRPQPVENVEQAIETGLHAVVVDEAAKAAEQAEAFWRSDPAGRTLVAHADLGTTSPHFDTRVAAEIRDWQGEVLGLIRAEGAGKRFTARMVSFGVNGVAVALMVVVFASTAGLTGLEVGIAGGTAVVGQKLLESIFGEDAVRRLAKEARAGLNKRVATLLAGEAERFLATLEDVPSSDDIDEVESVAGRLSQLARRSREATA
ncbi:dynamin family protein [Arthrobacter rhombi]|uniref:dynamin family protein n=1 Tax=Arthrobacter rhombi TaxID=71253 RepID=UPI003566B6FC